MITSAIYIMISLLLCLILMQVDGINYRAVARCPTNIKGDPSFTLRPRKKTRCISATTTPEEADNSRCAIVQNRNIFVTGKDSSFTIVKSTYNNDLKDGVFTETAPDGNIYKVIVLKVFPTECKHMYIYLRCSDTVGLLGALPQVQIESDVGPLLSAACLKKAADYTEKVLGNRLKFKMIQNKKCRFQKDFCSRIKAPESLKLSVKPASAVSDDFSLADDDDSDDFDIINPDIKDDNDITDDGYDPNFSGDEDYDKSNPGDDQSSSDDGDSDDKEYADD